MKNLYNVIIYLFIALTSCTVPDLVEERIEDEVGLLVGFWTIRHIESFNPFVPNTPLQFENCGFIEFKDTSGHWYSQCAELPLYEAYFDYTLDDTTISFRKDIPDYKIIYYSKDSIIINEVVSGKGFEQDPGLKVTLVK